jgi:hypothetical protein
MNDDYKFLYWDDYEYWKNKRNKKKKTFEDDNEGVTFIED